MPNFTRKDLPKYLFFSVEAKMMTTFFPRAWKRKKLARTFPTKWRLSLERRNYFRFLGRRYLHNYNNIWQTLKCNVPLERAMKRWIIRTIRWWEGSFFLPSLSDFSNKDSILIWGKFFWALSQYNSNLFFHYLGAVLRFFFFIRNPQYHILLEVSGFHSPAPLSITLPASLLLLNGNINVASETGFRVEN